MFIICNGNGGQSSVWSLLFRSMPEDVLMPPYIIPRSNDTIEQIPTTRALIESESTPDASLVVGGAGFALGAAVGDTVGDEVGGCVNAQVSASASTHVASSSVSSSWDEYNAMSSHPKSV